MLYVLKIIAIHKNSKPYRMTKEGPADINALAAHTTKAFKMDWNVKNRLKLIWTAYQIAKRARSGTSPHAAYAMGYLAGVKESYKN